MHCTRCGREAELLAGPDGAMYCNDCLIQAASPRCVQCAKCYQRRCGDAIYACPYCHGSPESARTNAETFERQLKEERVLAPSRVEEPCERCGGSLHGKAFILNGRALCKNCIIYEQERWEIVPGKPGKGGTRVKIVIERPEAPMASEAPGERQPLREDKEGRKLLGLLGVDPENPPPDPFTLKGPISEKPMPDDSCVNCEAYKLGKKSGKFLGEPRRKREK